MNRLTSLPFGLYANGIAHTPQQARGIRTLEIARTLERKGVPWDLARDQAQEQVGSEAAGMSAPQLAAIAAAVSALPCPACGAPIGDDAAARLIDQLLGGADAVAAARPMSEPQAALQDPNVDGSDPYKRVGQTQLRRGLCGAPSPSPAHKCKGVDCSNARKMAAAPSGLMGQIRACQGVNDTARAMSFIRSQPGGAALDHDTLHEEASKLLAQARR